MSKAHSRPSPGPEQDSDPITGSEANDENGSDPADQPAGRTSFEDAAKTTDRLRRIVDVAERAASEIIDDAEAQTRNYLEESQARTDRIAAQVEAKMSSLTDDLISRAEAVKRQSDELFEALDDARREVEEALRPGSGAMRGGEPMPAASRPEEHSTADSKAPPVERSSPPASASGSSTRQGSIVEEASPAPALPERESAESQPSEGARLLATQMAVAGSSREQIESRLQSEFDIRNTGSMLDEILGSGS